MGVTPELEATLKRLPDRPGVYLHEGRPRSTCCTSARPRACATASGATGRSTRRPWARATGSGASSTGSPTWRYTEVDSVSEALLLENNLIKRFKPRFNVRLKDDKSYPYIKVTLADDFPRDRADAEARQRREPVLRAVCLGHSVDESMNLVRRLFPFRTCTIDIQDGERALQRPCLLYHIKRCQGPCIQAISKADYRADIEQVELFLEGRQETLVKALRREMLAAADRQDYERAARLRDKIRAIERTMESQKMAAFARTELDLVGLARQDNQAAVTLFIIRDGKMIGRDVYLLDAAREASDTEVLTSFLEQYYARATSIPREIYVPAAITEADELETFLVEKRGGPVHLRTPQRGEKRDLLGLAERNAAETLQREHARWLADQGKTLAALEELAAALDVPGIPFRIECYDISTSRAASRSAAWSSSRTASRGPANTGGSGSGPSRGPTTSRATRRSCVGGSAARQVRRGRQRGGAPLGDARPRHRRRWEAAR